MVLTLDRATGAVVDAALPGPRNFWLLSTALPTATLAVTVVMSPSTRSRTFIFRAQCVGHLVTMHPLDDPRYTAATPVPAFADDLVVVMDATGARPASVTVGSAIRDAPRRELALVRVFTNDAEEPVVFMPPRTMPVPFGDQIIPYERVLTFRMHFRFNARTSAVSLLVPTEREELCVVRTMLTSSAADAQFSAAAYLVECENFTRDQSMHAPVFYENGANSLYPRATYTGLHAPFAAGTMVPATAMHEVAVSPPPTTPTTPRTPETRPVNAATWRVPRGHPRISDGSLVTPTTWIGVELDRIAAEAPRRARLHLTDPARNLLNSRIALVRVILYTSTTTPPVELEFALHHLAERTVPVITESARDITFRY